MKLHTALVSAINEGLMPRLRTKIEDLLPKMPEKASGEQIAAMLRNNGVSDHEIKWTKLETLLKQPKVTKDEIVNHLAEHGLPFTTTNSSEKKGHRYQQYALQGGKNYGEKIFHLEPSSRKPYPFEWDSVDPEYSDTNLQFNGYKPGADRSGRFNAPDTPLAEVLVEKKKYEEFVVIGRVKDENYYGTNSSGKGSRWVKCYEADPQGEDRRDLCIDEAKEACAKKLSQIIARDNDDSQDYKSGHWDGGNQLFHVRHQEFKDADGKDLWLIEEIQSDWHQEGRKKGYRGEAKAEVKHNPEHTDGFNYEVHIDGNRVSRHKDEESAKTSATSTEKNWTGNSVPDAPMKKTWEEMGFKWALHQAVEAGADRIGWITGEIAADRFEIAKQVDSLRIVDVAAKYPSSHKSGKTDGKRYRIMGDKNRENVFNRYADEDDLPGIVGKEVAKKLMDQPEDEEHTRTLSGEALKVGGEGMKAAYDQRIVSIAKKIAKITGAMVGKVMLGDAEDEGEEVDPYEVMNVEIKYGSETSPIYDTKEEYEEDERDEEEQGKAGWWLTFDGEKVEGTEKYAEYFDAVAAKESLGTIREAKKGHEVWYMDLNEKTRAMVAGGMRATFESVKPKTAKPWWIV